MGNYDFQTLSPIDFEEISRDLLQNELGLTFESFATGRDGGIDFRYSPDPSGKIIVQCKRYTTWLTLFSALKKEVPKAHALKPRRYLLTTSVPLTAGNKLEIAKLFGSCVRREADIFGREDLNNLLGKFPAIERKHFKLWLPSTTVLEKILHSRVTNQTLFELDDIKSAIQLYVENESFEKAAAILNSRRFVIISGIPGIGKTTLARMLVSNCLAGQIEELIVASESISEAYDLYKPGVSQVFFFDDFLGKVFLERPVSKNEDQRIIKFMERVSKSKDKLFILTTREYILSQAKEKLEDLNNKLINVSKCIIDLAQYTLQVRAKILYNHIYYSRVPKTYLRNLLRNQNYLKVIEHPNFSPRIIADTLMIEDVWKSIQPNAFTKTLIDYLNNPEKIWRRAYESQISSLSQCVLANMASAGAPILFDDLRTIMSRFAEKYSGKYGFRFNELEFRKSIRELDGSFILTKKASWRNDIVVNFYDPSVDDFLNNHITDNADFVNDILSTAPFFNQFFTIFELENVVQLPTRIEAEPIDPDAFKSDVFLDRIINEYDALDTSVIFSAEYSPYKKKSVFSKLYDLIYETNFLKYQRVEAFIRQRFKLIQYDKFDDDSDFDAYIEIVKRVGVGAIVDPNKAFEHYFDQVTSLHQFNLFEQFVELFSDSVEDVIDEYDFAEKIRDLIVDEARSRDSDEADEILQEAERIGRTYTIYTEDIEKQLQQKVAEYKDEKSHSVITYNKSNSGAGKADLAQIRNMFDSLMDIR